MQQGRGGMGSRKHGKSGRSGPGPKTKFMTAFDANRENEARKKPKKKMYDSIQEALAAEGRGKKQET